MSAGYLDLYLEQGEDFSASVSLDSINGYPYDLSSYSATSQIRKSYWSANAFASFSTTIAANGTSGIIGISLSSNTTINMKPGKYVYDIFLKNTSSNTRSKILEGIVFVDPSSTKI